MTTASIIQGTELIKHYLIINLPHQTRLYENPLKYNNYEAKEEDGVDRTTLRIKEMKEKKEEKKGRIYANKE